MVAALKQLDQAAVGSQLFGRGDNACIDAEPLDEERQGESTMDRQRRSTTGTAVLNGSQQAQQTCVARPPFQRMVIVVRTTQFVAWLHYRQRSLRSL